MLSDDGYENYGDDDGSDSFETFAAVAAAAVVELSVASVDYCSAYIRSILNLWQLFLTGDCRYFHCTNWRHSPLTNRWQWMRLSFGVYTICLRSTVSTTSAFLADIYIRDDPFYVDTVIVQLQVRMVALSYHLVL